MEDIESLKKRLARELRARREAEQLLETKSRDLFQANSKLSQLTRELQDEIETKSRELLAAQRVGRIGTFIKNLRTGQAHYSESAMRLYGLDPDSETDFMIDSEAFLHPDDAPGFRARLEKAVTEEMEPGHEQSSEYRILKQDGSIAWLNAHWEVRYDESSGDALLTGTVQDITEEKAAASELKNSYRQIETRVTELEQAREALSKARDDAEESDRSKSRFLAIMSHEIRTPLNGVLGALQLLDDSELNQRQSSLLQLALSSADGLHRLTNDVIDLSRLQAGRLELETRPFDIQSLVGEICQFWRPLAEKKGLVLEFIVQRDLPPRVLGDPARLRQILNNLLSNAIRFTEHGRVDVWLGRDEPTASGTSGQAWFRIDVQDTGIGIARNQQRRLFEDFAQISHPGAQEGSGAGLGLAICRELSTLMKGAVGVSSASGAGSKFWFRLPLEIDKAPIRAGECKPVTFAALTNLNGQAPSVLVAEDVSTNQLIVQMMLEGFGCRVNLVNNGVEAVNAMDHSSYDIVLMDVAMPEMDGVEATRRIRAMPGKPAILPIIGLTAFALIDEQTRFYDAGMDLVLSKPLQRAALYDALVSVLATPRTRPAHAAEKPMHASELDTLALAEITEGLSASQLTELLGRVVDDIATHAAMALDSVRAGDLEGLARGCHVLKGLAGSFGGRELTALAHRIEQHCRDSNAEAAMAVALGDLDRVCQSAQTALHSYQRRREAGDARDA